MKQKRKYGLLAFCAMLVLMMTLCSCQLPGNVKLVLTTGLSGDQLFKVGNSVCTLPEAMIYVMDYQKQYEGTYGVEMWEHDFGGTTLEEYVKESIISQLASMKAVTLLAKDYEVSLSDAEEERIEAAAEEYLEGLTPEMQAYMDVELSDVEALLETHVLSQKTYGEITRDVNTEVSDDEARIITIQQMRLETLEEAQDMQARLAEGKEFMTLASIYSEDKQITCTFGRGERETAYEEVAFSLEKDEVSEILELSDGFYLLKCTENFDREATQSNKTAMVEKRRDEIFGKVYEELIANTPSEFRTRLWETVHFENWEGTYPVSFQELYQAYFGS